MKILSLQATLASATNVDNAPVVRLFNSGTSNILLTRKDYAGTVLGSFMVPAGEVIYAEKYFTDTLEGSADVLATKTAYSSMMSFEGSSSTVPTYTHSVSSTAVDEGGSFTTTISTTNVDDGTNLYWELTGVVADDFSSGALTGTASISSNSATFSHTVDEDNLTEGTETATIKVYSDSGRNTQVGNTLTVTIADTSTTPPPTPGSTSFDGSNDYLYVGGNGARVAMADFGTGAYTIEFWMKTTKASQWIVFNAAQNTGVRIALGNNAGGNAPGQIEINEQSNNGDQYTTASGRVDDGVWHHIAFSRPDGGQVKLFVDGTLKATGADSGRDLSAGNGVDNFLVGRRGSGGPYFNGQMFGLRVMKGQALYTSSFTVPTSALTTTSQGADASKVTLLCCQTDDVTHSDVSPEAGNTLGVYGPTSSNDYPFAPNSVDFNGSNQALSLASSSDFAYGTGDFTVEMWVKPDDATPGYFCDHGSDNFSFGIQSGSFFYYNGTAGFQEFATASNQVGFWQHVAVSRTSGTTRTFINGLERDEFSDTHNFGSQIFTIGAYGPQNTDTFFNGKISNVRVVKGTGLYTGNFTVPTAKLEAVSGTVLLCCTGSTNTDSDVAPGAITAHNSPSVSSTDTPFASTYDIRVWADNANAWAYRALSINGTEVWNGLSDPGVQYQTFTGYSSFTSIRVTRVGNGGKARLAQVAVQRDDGGYKVLQDGVDNGYGSITWSSTGTATDGFSDPAADAFDGDTSDTSSPVNTAIGNYVDYTFSQFP